MKEPVREMQDTFTENSRTENENWQDCSPGTRYPDLTVPPQAADAEHVRNSKSTKSSPLRNTEKLRTKPRIRRAEHFHAVSDLGKPAILPSKNWSFRNFPLIVTLIECTHGAARTKNSQFHYSTGPSPLAAANMLVHVIYAVLRDQRECNDPEVDYDEMMVQKNAARWFWQMLHYQHLYYNDEGNLITDLKTCLHPQRLGAGRRKAKNFGTSTTYLGECCTTESGEDRFKSSPQFVAQKFP